MAAAGVLVGAAGCASGPTPARAGPEREPPRFVRGAPLAPTPTPPRPPNTEAAVAGGGAAESRHPTPDAPAGVREVFPHVRVDTAAHVVEFDAVVSPLLVKDERAPLFYLEVAACTPDTREHETLFVSKARPSHVHAAMLLIGLKPGEPGGWKLVEDRLRPVNPSGDRVDVRVAVPDPTRPGESVEADPLDWIISVRDGRSIRDSAPANDGGPSPTPGWVFAGSRMVNGRRAAEPTGVEPREVYEADGSGTLIGLATFGGETISWSRTFSPDASVDAPEWIAKLDATPPAGTAVVVRIRPAR